MIQYGIQARGALPVHSHITPEQGGIINNDDLFQSCGCFVYLNADQTIPTGINTKILFDRESFDIGGNFDADGVDSNFTSPAAGYYYVRANAAFKALADGVSPRIYIVRSVGVDLAQVGGGIGAAGSVTVSIGALVYLGLNEIVHATVFHNDVGDEDIESSAAYTYLSIFKIGE